MFARRTWKRLHPFSGLLIVLLIAAPWHVLATLRNPPYSSFTLHSAPGEYHGFLWFFFINEQLLRFLNLRYPRDYNTVPRLLVLAVPPAVAVSLERLFSGGRQAVFQARDRAGRARLLALCWTGFVLVFFTFSTTQEYYSMPCYPALALLLGSAMAAGGVWVGGARARSASSPACACRGAHRVLVAGAEHSRAGRYLDRAQSQRPGTYTLSLGHMEDLTLASFAYLRVPLALAAVAFLVGRAREHCAATAIAPFLAAALMMVLFFHAARLALVVFDPYPVVAAAGRGAAAGARQAS